MGVVNGLGDYLFGNPENYIDETEQAPTAESEEYTPGHQTAATYGAQQAGPNALAGATGDQSGVAAQHGALANLQQQAKGGLNDANRATLFNLRQQAGAQNRGQQGAIVQGAAQRGQGGAGSTLAAQLSEQQGEQEAGAASNANVLGQAADRATAANSAAASLGGQLDSSAFGKQKAIGDTQNRLGEFNATQGNEANRFNAGATNATSQFNVGNDIDAAKFKAGLLQQKYQNDFGRAAAQQGIQQAQNQATGEFLGHVASAAGAGISGAAAGGGGGSAGAPDDWDPAAGNALYSQRGYSHGGPVGNAATAPVPGDSTKNDVVPAMLSPGEVVIPRSKLGNPNKVLAFLEAETGMHFDGAMKKHKS